MSFHRSLFRTTSSPRFPGRRRRRTGYRLALTVAIAAVAAGACGRQAGTTRTDASLRDDFGEPIARGPAARRVVSLSPVTTELLFALGAGDRVVGRTHWDSYPAAARAVPDLGDGMRPNVEAVLGAHPDLVVLYASETNREAARRLRSAGITTIALHQDRVADFRRAAIVLGRAIGDSARGAALGDSVLADIAAQRAALPRVRSTTLFWHVWDAPIITIGSGSYLHELLTAAGGENIFEDIETASAPVALEEIVRRDPDFVLVGPTSAKKLRESAAWRSVRAVREGRLLVVDTALVGRPGVRMGEAVRSLHALLVSATR